MNTVTKRNKTDSPSKGWKHSLATCFQTFNSDKEYEIYVDFNFDGGERRSFNSPGYEGCAEDVSIRLTKSGRDITSYFTAVGKHTENPHAVKYAERFWDGIQEACVMKACEDLQDEYDGREDRDND